MINNNPYNIPQKPPMAKSKILSQYPFPGNMTNLHKKQQNQCLYNSAIFMKKSILSNNSNSIHEYPAFQQPTKVPLSPNHHFKPQSVQFLSSPYQNQNVQLNKGSYLQKSIKQINEQMSRVFYKLGSHDIMLTSLFQKKHSNSQRKMSTTSISTLNNENQFQSGQFYANLKSDFEEIKRQNQNMKRSISMFDSKFEVQLNQKIMEESKNLIVPFIQRMAGIETTIRQMGQDIHLINDKSQSLTQKMQNKFKQLSQEIGKTKNISLNRNQQTQIQKIKAELYKFQLSINKLSRDLQLKIDEPLAFYSKHTSQIQKLKAQIYEISQKLKQKQFSKIISSTLKSEGSLILKYLQKFQVINDTLRFVQKQILVNQITYYIDYQGYVLDNERYYLVDDRGDKVKLHQNHIQVLKSQHILI